MRLGLCAELKRLWIRLVIKTVLPERLKPVTASQTVAPPASSPRLSRSEAWAKIGGSQLKFTMDGISHPLDHWRLLVRGRQHRGRWAENRAFASGFGRWTAVHAHRWPRPFSRAMLVPRLQVRRRLILSGAITPCRLRLWRARDDNDQACTCHRVPDGCHNMPRP